MKKSKVFVVFLVLTLFLAFWSGKGEAVAQPIITITQHPENTSIAVGGMAEFSGNFYSRPGDNFSVARFDEFHWQIRLPGTDRWLSNARDVPSSWSGVTFSGWDKETFRISGAVAAMSGTRIRFYATAQGFNATNRTTSQGYGESNIATLTVTGGGGTNPPGGGTNPPKGTRGSGGGGCSAWGAGALILISLLAPTIAKRQK